MDEKMWSPIKSTDDMLRACANYFIIAVAFGLISKLYKSMSRRIAEKRKRLRRQMKFESIDL
ncbi:TPA_asm: P6 [Pinellia alphacytorhabdovirus 1]|nr:TPA_asm: P6 [Pinellia alphacytorhabdovirus 1]